MNKTKTNNSVFLPALILSICSLFLCMVCLAGTSWAWFTENRSLALDSIKSGSRAFAELKIIDNSSEKVLVGELEIGRKDISFSAEGGKTYTITAKSTEYLQINVGGVETPYYIVGTLVPDSTDESGPSDTVTNSLSFDSDWEKIGWESVDATETPATESGETEEGSDQNENGIYSFYFNIEVKGNGSVNILIQAGWGNHNQVCGGFKEVTRGEGNSLPTITVNPLESPENDTTTSDQSQDTPTYTPENNWLTGQPDSTTPPETAEDPTRKHSIP